MPRDIIVLDSALPPEDADDVEKLLWQGRCPWCGERAGFYPSEEFDGSLICANCGSEFMGPEDSDPGSPGRRRVDKVFKHGDPGKRGGRPDDLPTVTERPKKGLP
jgi:hypothetical protein